MKHAFGFVSLIALLALSACGSNGQLSITPNQPASTTSFTTGDVRFEVLGCYRLPAPNEDVACDFTVYPTSGKDQTFYLSFGSSTKAVTNDGAEYKLKGYKTTEGADWEDTSNYNGSDITVRNGIKYRMAFRYQIPLGKNNISHLIFGMCDTCRVSDLTVK